MTDAGIPKELPGDEPDDVLFNTLYGIRTIELNRPKKLNSLNSSMARKIVPRLKARSLVLGGRHVQADEDRAGVGEVPDGQRDHNERCR
jgi:hypothetical protein